MAQSDKWLAPSDKTTPCLKHDHGAMHIAPTTTHRSHDHTLATALRIPTCHGRRYALWAALALTLPLRDAIAQSTPVPSATDGFKPSDIVLGQTGPLSGPASTAFRLFLSGAALAFDAVNRAGGIKGRRIHLLTMDDELNPKQGAANLRTLAQNPQITALFSLVGQTAILDSAALIKAAGIPVFGATTGDKRSRERLGRPFFFTSPTYGTEAERIVAHLAATTVQKISMAYMGNPLGAEVRDAAEKKAQQLSVQVLASRPMDLGWALDIPQLVQDLTRGSPQAIVIFNTGEPLIRLVGALRQHPTAPRVYLFSLQDPAALQSALGDKAMGIVLGQVLPAPESVRHTLGSHMRQLLLATHKTSVDISPQQMQGFFNAQIVIEALKRCQGNITRGRLLSITEAMSNVNVGGIPVQFSELQRTGHEFIEMAMIGPKGRMVR